MKWKTITNEGGELGFVPVRNNSGSALSDGQIVVWDFSESDKVDGLTVLDPGSTTGGLVAGVACAAVADRDKCLAQVYGPKSNVMIRHVGSATDGALALGDILDINSTGSCLAYAVGAQAEVGTTQGAQSAATTYCPPMFVMAQSLAVLGTASTASSVSVTTTAKVFIRCL